MTIPLDRLYHYIESIARDIRGDAVIIYRFFPHGSKKIEDIYPIREIIYEDNVLKPAIYCYDQEPLNYQLYENVELYPRGLTDLYKKYNIPTVNRNLMVFATIYDRVLLLHSEKRSTNKNQYQQSTFITVYYWSHGLIALDWYRFAQYEKVNKKVTCTFLIYNRAWSGTREYRLKFVDLLIDYKLVSQCKMGLNATEPELNIHYSNYTFTNLNWEPHNKLEEHISKINSAPSSASADYDITDYNSTEVEVVLETIFDDDRLQLTEKILRPIALGQPFLLAATHGSLEYLRSYGFRTFASVFDESYDTIENPVERLEAIVKTMKAIADWTESEKVEKLALANQIAAYNRKHFFSSKFVDQITDELKTNLKCGLEELERTNTSEVFLSRRRFVLQYPEIKNYFFNISSRQGIVKILQKARSYYNRIRP